MTALILLLSMWYNPDIYKFGLQLLPPLLRKKTLFALLRALLFPFRVLSESFQVFRRNCLNRLNVNGQVIYIEKALNDAFELKDGEIYLTDTDDGSNCLLYADAALTMEVYAGGENNVLRIPSANEGKHGGDFVVNVPSFLEDEIGKIKTIVEYNKPAGRSYVINIYEYE